jgi:ribonuclease J
VLTGSQGEGRAALNRAAQGKHPQLKMGPGDLILWSARFIPGNERRIWRLINMISLLGVRVVHPLGAQIHTSGHARQDELRTMIELVRPKHFIPVHGEYAFLVEHAKLAQDSGVTSTLIVHNGQEVAVKPDADLQVIKEHELDAFFVDGSVTAEADDLNLADKRKMFMNGVVVAQISAAPGARDPQVNVSLKSRGIFTDDGRLLNLAREFVRDELLALSPDEFTRDGIEELTRIIVRRFFKKQIGKKPLVVSFVNKAGG